MTLIEKLENDERLSLDEGIALYDLDLFTLGKYANQKRRALHGDKVFLTSIAISILRISAKTSVNFVRLARTAKIPTRIR